MGFFYASSARDAPASKSAKRDKVIPIHLLNQSGCSACPLDKEAPTLYHPKQTPLLPRDALIYVLGEAPSEEDDERGEAMVGKSGQLLRSNIPKDLLARTVFDNTIRCKPPGGRAATEVEFECCRGHVEESIAKSKPLVVIGAGAVPFSWATKLGGGILKWRGRMVPINVRGHNCWFFPVLNPAYVLRNASKHYKTEWDFTFEHDLRRIFKLIDRKRLPPPTVVSSGFFDGVQIFDGSSAQQLRELEAALVELAREPYVGIDIETKNLRPYSPDSRILSCAIGTFDRVVSFAVDHPDGWNSSQRRTVFELLQWFLLNSGRKIAQKLSFEQEWFGYFYGREILRRTEWEDTNAQAHVLDERPGTDMSSLTMMYFGFDIKAQSTVDRKNPLSAPIKDLLRYNGGDSKWTYQLFFRQRDYIEAVPEFVGEYERLLRVIPTLTLSQLDGVPANIDYAEKTATSFRKMITAVESRISRLPQVAAFALRFQRAFKPGSPDDVLAMLTDIYGRTDVVKKGGKESSDESILSGLPAHEVPMAPMILELRGLSKLVSTYLDPVIDRKIVYDDGRIHTNFNCTVTATGRLSSDSPNLQNFPKRKHREVRAIVGAYLNGWIISADYGQIEARTIAMASEDKNLCKHLWTNYDIHGHWANRIEQEFPAVYDLTAAVYDIDVNDEKKVRKELRQRAKNEWVFPQFYGSAHRSCAASLGMPEDTSKRLAGEFWDEFTGIKKWQDKIIAKYERELYVETLSGRRRRGPLSRNKIINTVSQGTASDIVVDAMERLSVEADILDLPFLQAPLNVHDDLTFFVGDADLDSAVDHIALRMCQCDFDYINVPILVEVSVGKTWDQTKEIGTFRSDQLEHLKAMTNA